jgi:hypothetical protein
MHTHYVSSMGVLLLQLLHSTTHVLHIIHMCCTPIMYHQWVCITPHVSRSAHGVRGYIMGSAYRLGRLVWRVLSTVLHAYHVQYGIHAQAG